MPPDPKVLLKPDRKRPVKTDTSKKKEPILAKSVVKPSSNRDAKSEKYRGGSVDRANAGRSQDVSRTRQARSVDRSKEVPKTRDSKEKEKVIKKTQSEVKTKSLDKKPEVRKTLGPTPIATKEKSKQLSHRRNDIDVSKKVSSKIEKKADDLRRPSVSNSVSNSRSRKQSIDQGSGLKISVRKKESPSDRKPRPHRDKTASFVVGNDTSPVVRPRTSTIRKGPDASNNLENIPGSSHENKQDGNTNIKSEDVDSPGAKEENNAEEGYNYDDDFEEYDSDFEEESDVPSVSDVESDHSSEHSSEKEEEDEMSETETAATPQLEDKNEVGLFLHPTIVKRATPIPTPSKKVDQKASREILRMSEKVGRYDDPEKEEASTGNSTMKTSRSFINFAGAKEERQKKKIGNKILKRGMELLEIITLDKVSFDVFDMPPMKYDVYIRSFGRSNTKQVYIQTENTEDEEIETDEIEVQEKWTQHPPHDHFGVGGDANFASNKSEEDWRSHFKTDAVKLNKFVQNIAPVVLALLAEDLPNLSLRQITEKRPNVLFSQGYYKLTPLPFCKDAPVIHLSCSPVSENYLISVHGNMCAFPATEILVEEKGVICVWNLFDISTPEYVLISNSQPVCSCFGPSSSSTIIAGMVDGSLMLWDLTEPTSGHYQIQNGTTELVLRSPTYNTAAVVGEDHHHGCVVSVQTAHYSSSKQDFLKDGINNNKGLPNTFHVLSLEDMGILNVWVVVEVSKPDPSGSESDLGLSPGGRLRLIRSSTILLQSLNVLAPEILTGIRAFDFRMLPSDLNHVLVATDAGVVLHLTRHSGVADPKYYSYDAGPSVEMRSVDCSPHNDWLFLVGSSDGSVRLHNIKSVRPVMVWPQAAGGEPVQLVQWSTNQPAMFYVLDTISNIYIWDLRKNTSTPTQKCHFDGPRITWFALNGNARPHTDSNCPSLMAVAKEDGEIEVHALKQQVDIINEAEYKRQINFMQSL